VDSIWFDELMGVINCEDDIKTDTATATATATAPVTATKTKTANDTVKATSILAAFSGAPVNKQGRKRSVFSAHNPNANYHPLIGCWGTILLRKSKIEQVNQKQESEWEWECLLVRTLSGHDGFPKGKWHKGETARETAARETYEETGFSASQWVMTGNVLLEHNDKGNPSVAYFVAIVDPEYAQQAPLWDLWELKQVAWYKINDALALESLLPRRKQILLAAIKQLV